MSAVRVKICGLMRASDVRVAIDCGADALGFVFAGSARRLSVAKARGLTEGVPHGIMRVGLFMDPVAEDVDRVLQSVPLDLLQFHGTEDNAFCRRFGVPFLKAVSMKGRNPRAVAQRYPDAVGILLDSHEPGAPGGTGQRFDWTRRLETGKPVWLAGGLTPANVAEAVRRLRPYAVDVSSGVEDAPGEKNPHLIRSFIEAARQA